MRISRLTFLKLAPTALALSMAGLFNGGCVTSTTTTNEPVRFRVMSYNIHHGKDLTARWTRTHCRVGQKEAADICGLQEVDKGVERTKRRDLPAELAALTGMTCIFSNNYNFQGGEYGNAVLTPVPGQGL